MAALQQAPQQGLEVSLSVHAHCGTGLSSLEDSGGDWADVAALPSMAGVRGLTERRLFGFANPPPDWWQLASLRRLVLRHYCCGPQFAWGHEPLSALTALTRIDLHGATPPGALLQSRARGAASAGGR